ncbi:hypothetical protein MKEN_00240100 [Mycena kentingensis (nom. inval.)]|nr:hypothetical protein MKEN_00240100 [Mycena kentingensis (nom. inval.)]
MHDDDTRALARHFLSVVNGVTNGLSIPGVCLSVVLLVAVGILRCNRASRPHLDRVSFRLLIYALVANVIFGLMIFIPMTEHNPACSFVALIGTATPMFSAAMFCTMAINLQLIFIWGLNGSKLRLERYYILGAVALCMIRINTLRADTLASAESAIKSTSLNSITSESLPQPPILRYRAMIIRIGLYPLLACFLSVTACICDVYSILNTEVNEYNVRIRILELFAYCLRPLLYALLVATDPAFIRAVRAFKLPKRCFGKPPRRRNSACSSLASPINSESSSPPPILRTTASQSCPSLSASLDSSPLVGISRPDVKRERAVWEGEGAEKAQQRRVEAVSVSQTVEEERIVHQI